MVSILECDLAEQQSIHNNLTTYILLSNLVWGLYCQIGTKFYLQSDVL